MTKPLCQPDYAVAIKELRDNGFAVIRNVMAPEIQARLKSALDRSYEIQCEQFGEDYLRTIQEHNVLRCPLYYDSVFLELACHPALLTISRELIGGYVVLNQQNGLLNPPDRGAFSQHTFHRDLPYQSFTSSRPLALNFLYAADDFTKANGATHVLTGSHRHETFPSDSACEAIEQQVEAPAGSIIALDCMVFHKAGVNQTQEVRRAVNTVYAIPLIKQQISLPDLLGGGFSQDTETRRLLGYDLTIPDNVRDYYAMRERRLR